MVVVAIPTAVEDDDADVRWALTTAANLLQRGEKKQALGWLRHAAHAAETAGAMPRAGALFKAAAALAEALDPYAAEATSPQHPAIQSMSGAPTARADTVPLHVSRPIPLGVRATAPSTVGAETSPAATYPSPPPDATLGAAGAGAPNASLMPISAPAHVAPSPRPGPAADDAGEQTMAVAGVRMPVVGEATRPSAKLGADLDADVTLGSGHEAMRVAVVASSAGAVLMLVEAGEEPPAGSASALLLPATGRDAMHIIEMVRAGQGQG